jgi:hypothetical protein
VSQSEIEQPARPDAPLSSNPCRKRRSPHQRERDAGKFLAELIERLLRNGCNFVVGGGGVDFVLHQQLVSLLEGDVIRHRRLLASGRSLPVRALPPRRRPAAPRSLRARWQAFARPAGLVPVPTFGPRMVCSRCGIIGADARPNSRNNRLHPKSVREHSGDCAARARRVHLIAVDDFSIALLTLGQRWKARASSFAPQSSRPVQ